jgi:outer membrane usher protein
VFDSKPRQTPVPSDRSSKFLDSHVRSGTWLLSSSVSPALRCFFSVFLLFAVAPIQLSAQIKSIDPQPIPAPVLIQPLAIQNRLQPPVPAPLLIQPQELQNRLARTERRVDPVEMRLLGRERPPIEETVVSVSINKQPVAAAVAVLQVRGLGVVIPYDDFTSLRLTTVKTPVAIRGEAEYVPLARLPGITAQINTQTLELNIDAPPKMFAVTRLAMESRSQGPVTPAATGAFLNYDLLAFQSRVDKIYGGTFEGVLFNRFGSLVSNLLVNKTGEDRTRGIRLDTYYQMDFPDRLNRLRVGDNITTAGSWGRAVRYGGIKFGTDFSLSPNLVAMPLLNIGATASVPSSVDLYVNNALQRRFNVPPGPFSIDQIPIITGAGNARIVVRNALGQDQVIEVPFLRVPLQLRAGLSDYALELGRLRNNFGLRSNDYDALVAAGIWRYGVSDRLTTELRAETQRQGPSTAGAAAVYLLGGGHTINPGLVASHSDAGSGLSSVMGYSYTSQFARLSARYEHNNAPFRQLGYGVNELPPVRRLFASGGYRVTAYSDLGFAYSDSAFREADRVRVASVNASTRLARNWYVSAAFSRVLTSSPSNSLSVTLVWSGDHNDSALLGYQKNTAAQGAGNDYGYARYTRRPEYSGGYGYEAEIGTGPRGRLKGEALNTAGLFTVEAARLNVDAGTAARATARGALVAIDGAVQPSRSIDDSFIAVRAPEVPGAQVTRSGGRVYTLDSSGRVIIDRVQPYLDSNVQVAASSLPIEATVGALENRVRVPAKAGVVVDLKIKKTKSVTFRLLFDGKPAVVGSTVEFGALKHPVGLNGLVFIQDTGKGGDALARIGQKYCTFRIPEPPAEPVPDLGDLICTSQPLSAGGG